MRKRLAVVLPGLHRVSRGAETAFESVAREMSRLGDWDVTLFGSGAERDGEPYEFRHVPCTPRERFERWPSFPVMRSEVVWEEWSFARRLGKVYEPEEFDATMTCAFPFCNWFLRRRRARSGRRPAHVFVTQNGDWPCQRRNSEFRWFGCDALVCTNPEYFERHRAAYRATLIPNGVDPAVFHPGPEDRSRFGLPEGEKVVLMVSALIPSKRVLEGIEAVARVGGAWLVVAGDGPLRESVDRLGRDRFGKRFVRISIERAGMPGLYRCADMLLHMSRDEPFGNVYTEALASGLPIVAHDRPVTRWTLGETSYPADTGDVDAAVGAINAALGEAPGSRTRERLSLVRERYTWASIARQYADTIAAAIREGHRIARSEPAC